MIVAMRRASDMSSVSRAVSSVLRRFSAGAPSAVTALRRSSTRTLWAIFATGRAELISSTQWLCSGSGSWTTVSIQTRPRAHRSPTPARTASGNAPNSSAIRGTVADCPSSAAAWPTRSVSRFSSHSAAASESGLSSRCASCPKPRGTGSTSTSGRERSRAASAGKSRSARWSANDRGVIPSILICAERARPPDLPAADTRDHGRPFPIHPDCEQTGGVGERHRRPPGGRRYRGPRRRCRCDLTGCGLVAGAASLIADVEDGGAGRRIAVDDDRRPVRTTPGATGPAEGEHVAAPRRDPEMGVLIQEAFTVHRN